MLHHHHAAPSPCCTITMLHQHHAAPVPYCTSTMLHQHHAAPMPCAPAPCCTSTILHKHHTGPAPCSTSTMLQHHHAAPAPCCTNTILPQPVGVGTVEALGRLRAPKKSASGCTVNLCMVLPVLAGNIVSPHSTSLPIIGKQQIQLSCHCLSGNSLWIRPSDQCALLQSMDSTL
jgi:hypothetical protein